MAPGVRRVLGSCHPGTGLVGFQSSLPGGFLIPVTWGGQDCCHPGGDSILGSPGLETASWILEAASWVGIVKAALDSFLEFWAVSLEFGRAPVLVKSSQKLKIGPIF